MLRHIIFLLAVFYIADGVKDIKRKFNESNKNEQNKRSKNDFLHKTIKNTNSMKGVKRNFNEMNINLTQNEPNKRNKNADDMKELKRKFNNLNINSAQNQQNKRNKNKNVLFISTNHRPDHFIINCDFASVLARHYNVVCYLFSQT